ncbi:uncharacterized protein LOC135226333 [Macrobrachium nipponense]|uniref:uncharacterized protein LOC135226333 n=1 Tax=Macrobrachium nipponense TaxID=159736 RepID=UPI0030C89C6A
MSMKTNSMEIYGSRSCWESAVGSSFTKSHPNLDLSVQGAHTTTCIIETCLQSRVEATKRSMGTGLSYILCTEPLEYKTENENHTTPTKSEHLQETGNCTLFKGNSELLICGCLLKQMPKRFFPYP